MKEVIGLISDTHGVLLPEAVRPLSGSTIIIHAGDIGEPRFKSRLKASELILALEAGGGATVKAIKGNVDEKCPATQTQFPAHLVLDIAGRRFLIIHICGFPPNVDPLAANLIATEQPDVVVFGHSHVPGVQLVEEVLYINPGSAGPRRFRLPQSVALVEIDEQSVRVHFIDLDPNAIEGQVPADFVMSKEL